MRCESCMRASILHSIGTHNAVSVFLRDPDGEDDEEGEGEDEDEEEEEVSIQHKFFEAEGCLSY